MGNMAEMNRVADGVVDRDDAPFHKMLDTEVFIPTENRESSLGSYELRRTGGEGIATLQEFESSFYGELSPPPFNLSLSDYQLGIPITGFNTPQRTLRRGIVAAEPFYTVKRTPEVYPLGQTTDHSITDKYPRHYRVNAFKMCSYVGSLWLAIEYSGEDEPMRAYTSLRLVTRDSVSELAVERCNLSPLIFGEDNVKRALAAVRR